MKLRLITLLLFISSVAFGQSSYLQVGNTLQQKDTVINGVTQKTYRTNKGSTGYEYFPTRGWVLARDWAISRVTGLQDSLNSKLNKSGGAITGQLVLKESSSSSDFTKGLRFTNDPFGGSGDISGLRLYSNSGENQILELYVGDNTDSIPDIINFKTATEGFQYNNNVRINGNIILNSANYNNYSPSLTGEGASGSWNINAATVTTNANLTGDVNSSGNTTSYNSIVPSIKGGSGVNNSGTLTWGSGGVLGSNAFSSTAYLPLTGGTLSGGLTGTSAIFTNRLTGYDIVSSTNSYLPSDYKIYFDYGVSNNYSIGKVGADLVYFAVSGSHVFGQTLTGTSATFSGSVQTGAFPTISSATSGRIPYFTTGGQMTDDADLTFDGTNLSVATPTSGGHAVNKTYADLKAPLASPALTGTPTAPTQTAGDNSTKIATTAYVESAIPITTHIVEPDNFSPVSSDGVYSYAYSGTYTPTITSATNISNITIHECRYTRIGDNVSVDGVIEFDNSTTSGYMDLSLPVAKASNFTVFQDAGGQFATNSTSGDSGQIEAVGGDKKMAFYMNFPSGSSTSKSLFFHYSYRIN